MKLYTLTIILFFIYFANLAAQHTDEDDHLGHHDHHNHEIGVGNSLVYFIREAGYSYGLHLHYIYNFPHSRWGIGAEYEKIFDEHGHNSIGIIASFRPLERLIINFVPGVSFESGEHHEPKLNLHLESTYEFMLGDFHIGPIAGIAYDTEDIHIGLGLHLGFGF